MHGGICTAEELGESGLPVDCLPLSGRFVVVEESMLWFRCNSKRERKTNRNGATMSCRLFSVKRMSFASNRLLICSL